MRKFLLITLITLSVIYPYFSYSAPEITNVTGGIISGSSFGTKVQAEPIKFETFERNDSNTAPTIGEELSDQITYWSDRGIGHTNPVISVDNLRGVSTRSVRTRQKVVDGVTTYDEMAWRNDIPFGSGKFLVSFWIYFQWDTAVEFQPTKTYYQVKTFSIGAGIAANGSTVVPPEWGMFNFHGNGPDSLFNTADDYTWSYFRNTAEGGGSRGLDNDTFPPNETGGWYLITMEIDQGTPYTADGSWKVYNTTPDMVAPIIVNGGTNTQIRGTTPFGGFKFGWYINAADVYNAEVNLQYDDIYIDNSWARVEIGDEPIYANCRHREIQPAATWSDTGITVTLNIGSFSPTATVYFFVVDEDGVASAGKEVALGGTPTYNPPTITAPSDFSTTASSVEIEGAYGVDPDLPDQSVVVTWTLGEDSGFAVAALGVFSCTVPVELGSNSIVFQVVDSNAGEDLDTTVVTRTLPFTLKTHGSVTFKSTTLH